MPKPTLKRVTVVTRKGKKINKAKSSTKGGKKYKGRG